MPRPVQLKQAPSPLAFATRFIQNRIAVYFGISLCYYLLQITWRRTVDIQKSNIPDIHWSASRRCSWPTFW